MSETWKDNILKDLVMNVAKLTLVSDPDSLLSEEIINVELKNRGFEIVEFQDPIAFRYIYESKYRPAWEKKEGNELIVLSKSKHIERELPYDLLKIGRKLSFSLGDLFPNMSYPVIKTLDLTLLASLFDAQKKISPKRMGDNQTKDFILRHIFRATPELITTEKELLQLLLRMHNNSNIKLSTMLATRLVEVLERDGNFKEWNLSEIIQDPQLFITFLQEHWTTFSSSIDLEKNFWALSSVSKSKLDDKELRISRLFGLVDETHLSMESRYNDWLSFAMKWSELSALIHTTNSTENKQLYHKLSKKVNTLFADWLDIHYASLINLSPTSPAMLHHVLRHMARFMEEQKSDKVALLVIDGLSLDQWVTVRNILQTQNNDLILRESATFAWIPTLTSVSRQALFAGKSPIYFTSSINSTNNEEKLWKQFWEDYDMDRSNIIYKRSLGDGDAEAVIENLINPSTSKVVGLVIDKVDKIMHGMQLGSSGMHNQIAQWCQDKYLISLLNCLLDYGYDVWITSDHGNIESIGKGRPLEGSIAETRGERVRIYPTSELRSRVATKFSFAQEWHSSALPDDYFPLITTGNNAFVREGESIVSHGGISMEEVIVPLVKVERKTQP